MKLSVSAYRAQASAHKKILSNYQHQHQLSHGASYFQSGGVTISTAARSPSDPAAVLPGFKVLLRQSSIKPCLPTNFFSILPLPAAEMSL